ncbi:U32 family peptidase [Schlesneria paludicola]|uniref:U32 family peptidase n=1 Tax=Schlesneria paludicola TaxID=360056 RepID=UPI001ED8FB9B|nr:U32 family peptidase [Schlesneria paludicola]
MRAAVENGADAVYFGLNCGFNARARATNVATRELREVMKFLHHRGVKGYVTLNTLAFTDELSDLESLIRTIAESDVDAVLVQDLGVLHLVRAVCPDLPIHASTQMTLTSAESIRVAEELGVERVVLPRELSFREIAQIRHSTTVALECFVHGALCVAYSGQCLTSESLGGRSANRGQCAQACRLPYDLICDGQDVDLGAQKYLLSPQDLAAYELTPDLIAAGVSSFKIEGRLKTPEYVANMTRHYREAIDMAMRGELVEFSRDEVREMELSFSRGFSPGWLLGDDHKMLVPALSSAKRGVLLGTIEKIYSESVEVKLDAPVARGDGVVFTGDRAASDEQGGRIFEVLVDRIAQPDGVSNGIVELEFQRGAIDFSRLSVGQAIWKTDDPALTARLKRSYSGPDPIRKRPLSLAVRTIAGQPAEIEGTLSVDPSTDAVVTARVISSEPLAVARKHPITVEFLAEQLGRLGNTAYELAKLETEISGNPMIPLSVLSKLRQELVARLDEVTIEPRARTINPPSTLKHLKSRIASNSVESTHAEEAPRLHLLCRTLAQIEVVTNEASSNSNFQPELIYADFQDIREYRQAVALARAADLPIYVAPTRIQKPSEAGLFSAIAKYEPDGLLVRNLAGMRFCTDRKIPFVTDYSLNATNELTVDYLLRYGAQRITASYDLNRDQLLELVSAVRGDRLEIVIHQHMPMFHMEHCVFCAVLSPGTNKTNCGRPCDTHLVQLRDRVGSEHPLKADVGCRNTLYNAVPQSAADVVPELLAQGVRDFRVEFLDDQPDDLRRVLALYRDLLRGQIRGEDVWRQLNAANRVGVTRGTLEERRNPLAIL